MCEYCESYPVDGEDCITPLPAPDERKASAQICIGERYLVACMLQLVVAGQINYCPMCGRDSRSATGICFIQKTTFGRWKRSNAR